MPALRIPTFDEWCRAIGHFLLSFGHLEYLSLEYLEKKLANAEYQRVCEWGFEDRMEKAAATFGSADERRDAFQRLRVELAPLRMTRNHLAHGFLEFVARPDPAAFVLGVTQAKDVGRGVGPATRHITLLEIEHAIVALDASIKEFRRLTDDDAA